MREDIKRDLTHLIESAVDLANCIQADLKGEYEMISDETVTALNRFREEHANFSEILDLVNGIN